MESLEVFPVILHVSYHLKNSICQEKLTFQENINFGNVAGISNYYFDYYGNEWEFLDDEEKEEMEEEEEEEEKELEEGDISVDLLTQFRESTIEKKTAEIQLEKGKLRGMVGVIPFC